MLNLLRAGARFFQNNIGWNRIGVLLSLAIITVAVVVLVHMLRDIDVDEVIAALKATEPRHIAAAAVFVAGGYFTLTFYDWFALRTIGRKEIPYRIAALSGFTSYSIGHNIGATVFTGGAVRYRIYSAYGLDAIEVAKICFVAGLTFWLGNATVLGLGVCLYAAGRGLDRPAAGLGSTAASRARMLMVLGVLCRLGLERAARDRAGRMESAFAERAVDAAADRHRHSRSRLLCARHVHAAAERAEYRFRDAGGGVRVGDAARLRQPCARRSRRVRRRHAGGLVAIRQGKMCWRDCCCSGCFIIWRRSSIALIILGAREIWLNTRGARAKPALHPVTSVTAPLRSEIESRENQRRLTMASEDNSANLPRGAGLAEPPARRMACAARQVGRGCRYRARAADMRPHRRASAGAADRVADRRTARTGDRARPRRPRHCLQRGGVGDRAVAAPRRTGLDHLAHARTGRCDPARHRQPDAATGGILRARAARPLVRSFRDAGEAGDRRRRALRHSADDVQRSHARCAGSRKCAPTSSPMPAMSCARRWRRCSASSRPCRAPPRTIRRRAPSSSPSCRGRPPAWRA